MKRSLILAVTTVAALAIAYLLYLRFQAGAPPEPLGAPNKPEITIDIAGLEAKAARGDGEAQSQLGKAYIQGLGVKIDYKQAALWYGQAASNGNVEAEAMLGELCQAGQGTHRDLAAAVQHFTRAGEHGSTTAQYDLGYMYEQGQGVRHDEKLAAHWYQLASEGGDPLAQFDYGQRCVLGVGVAQDQVEGLKWLLLSAAQGQKDARAKAESVEKNLTGPQISEAKGRAAAFTPRAPIHGN